MTIEVKWANTERTALLVQAVSKWTWDDFYASRQAMTDMLAGLDHQVDMLIDGGNFGLPPNALSNFRRHSWDQDPHIRRVVLVAQHSFMRAMYQMYTTLVRKDDQRLLMVASLEEAFATLERINS